MKQFIILMAILGIINSGQSQNPSVEQSVFGVQTGILGVWGHNELKLIDAIALRTEIGFDTGVFGSDVNDIDGFFLTPVLSLEPRWYYNLNKRVDKSKRVDGNSGNFISLKITYHPDWFTISSEEDLDIISDISIVPTWGIRRNLGDHFNYEAGFGIGYIRYLDDEVEAFFDKVSDVAVNLHLRIGYRF